MGICDCKMIQFMPANNSNTNRVITILIHSDKTLFQNVFVTLLCQVGKDVTSSLLSWHKHYDFNAADFDITANENARYKHNELKYTFLFIFLCLGIQKMSSVNKNLSLHTILGSSCIRPFGAYMLLYRTRGMVVPKTHVLHWVMLLIHFRIEFYSTIWSILCYCIEHGEWPFPKRMYYIG